MNPNLLFDRYTEEDLVEYFSDYSKLELQSNLIQLIQINIIYSYCESKIIDDLNCTESEIAKIIKYCKENNNRLFQSDLPFAILHKLKKVKNDIVNCDLERHEIIDFILNVIVENTLLYTSLAKFAYN